MANVVTTVSDKPFFLQAGGADAPLYYDAEDFRRYTGAIWNRDGALGLQSMYMTQATIVGWSLRIEAGYAVIANRYLFHLQTAATISILGLNTNPAATRTHKVYACIFDKLVSGSEYAQKIVIAEDTGTGAIPPADATYTLLLGTFTITSGQANLQSTHISNTVTHAAMESAIVPISNLMAGYEDAASSTGCAAFAQTFGNNICRLQGSVRRTGSANFIDNMAYHIATLPSILRPKTNRFLSVSSSYINTSKSNTAMLQILTTGTMTVWTPDAFIAAFFFFDGISYPMD